MRKILGITKRQEQKKGDSTINTLEKYFEDNKISQPSERMFVEEFIVPIIGLDKLWKLKSENPFIDQSGRQRRIDFAFSDEGYHRIAFEIDGESYHAEGAITSEEFDDSLFRQNDLVLNNWIVLRFSYTQLQDQKSRHYVFETIKYALQKYRPDLLPPSKVKPNGIQEQALDNIEYARSIGKTKGVVVMPTGERVIIVMGAVCVIKSRVSGTLNKYISCIA